MQLAPLLQLCPFTIWRLTWTTIHKHLDYYLYGTRYSKEGTTSGVGDDLVLFLVRGILCIQLLDLLNTANIIYLCFDNSAYTSEINGWELAISVYITCLCVMSTYLVYVRKETRVALLIWPYLFTIVVFFNDWDGPKQFIELIIKSYILAGTYCIVLWLILERPSDKTNFWLWFLLETERQV